MTRKATEQEGERGRPGAAGPLGPGRDARAPPARGVPALVAELAARAVGDVPIESGRLTVRVFWDELVQSPCDLAVEVGDLLRSRGWTAAPRACRRGSCTVRTGRTAS